MPDAPGYSTPRALDALLHALDEGALVFDEHGTCRAAGRRAAEILGVDVSALVGQSRADLLARASAAADTPSALAPLTRSDGEPRTVVDPIEIVRPAPCTVVWTSVPIPGDGGAVAGRVDLIRDVTRERRAAAAIDELSRRLELESTHDDLTGLNNRRRFEEECLREHRRAQREWISYAVARLDVDGMGGINERLGREVGDALLKRIGDDLRTSRREYDVVARWKDDELVVLLPRVDALALGRILRRALDTVHAGARAVVPGVTVCVGASIWTPPSADGPTDILRHAGDALSAARARGPGRVEVHLGGEDWKDQGTGHDGGDPRPPGG